MMGTWADQERQREHERQVAFNLGAQSRDDDVATLQACVAAAESERRRLVAQYDAEIARLKERITEYEDDIDRVLGDQCAPDEQHCSCVPILRRSLAAHKRALAAGPARLRALRSDDYSPGYVAGLVEAAQEAAMKAGT